MRTKLATAGLALVLGGVGLALAPAASAAGVSSASRTAGVAAPEFSVNGRWQFVQSGGITVTMNVTQDSSGRLFGTASWSGAVGTIEEGAVEGRNIFFTVGWSNGARGRYTGSLGPDRRLSGTTFDLNNPTHQANWVTTRTF